MGLISASYRSWLTFLSDGNARGQQQNLVSGKTPESHLIEFQIEYHMGFQNVTWHPSVLIQIIAKVIFPLTHGLQNGMLNISQIQDPPPFRLMEIPRSSCYSPSSDAK